MIEWLAELLGLPRHTEGGRVSGGSLANLTALTVARTEYGPGVAYLTDQTHASIARGLWRSGFTEDQIRTLETDDAFRMRPDALEAAIAEDVRRGRRPVAVVATAGTTNTGSIDPLDTLADLSERHDVWFHIDGAYGAPAALDELCRRAMRGIERADLLALDPHKWLFQPYDVGCVFVTRAGALERTYFHEPRVP